VRGEVLWWRGVVAQNQRKHEGEEVGYSCSAPCSTPFPCPCGCTPGCPSWARLVSELTLAILAARPIRSGLLALSARNASTPDSSKSSASSTLSSAPRASFWPLPGPPLPPPLSALASLLPGRAMPGGKPSKDMFRRRDGEWRPFCGRGSAKLSHATTLNTHFAKARRGERGMVSSNSM